MTNQELLSNVNEMTPCQAAEANEDQNNVFQIAVKENACQNSGVLIDSFQDVVEKLSELQPGDIDFLNNNQTDFIFREIPEE